MTASSARRPRSNARWFAPGAFKTRGANGKLEGGYVPYFSFDAAYRYGDKSYRVAVNACTGEVQGERPYSAGKVALAVLAGLALVAVIVSLAQR